MAEDNEKKDSQQKEEQKVTETPKVKKGGVGKIIALIFILIGGLIIGKIQWDKYATKKRANSYLNEAKSFIEKRRFKEATEAIALAEETLPGRPENKSVEEALELEQKVDSLEKSLSVSLSNRDWAKSDKILSNLMLVDSENDKIAPSNAEVAEGRLNDKRDELETALVKANNEDDAEAMLRLSDELITLDPTNEKAATWKQTRSAMEVEVIKRRKKARQIFEQAKELDTGEYNGEVLFLANQAKELTSDPVYQAFFDKVNSYPRTLLYPGKYPTIQETINAARPIDIVQLKEGNYNSPVVINKKVTILGVEGRPVIIHCSGASGAALYVSPEGELEAEHVMFKHTDTKNEEGSAYSVVIVSGKASFTSCLFFESAGHGIHVRDGGIVSLLACRSEANTWDGYAVSGKGSLAKIDASISTKNLHHGIDAWDEGAISFKDSISEFNLKSGTVATKNGSLSIIGSTIRSNTHAGLYVTEGGNAKVVKSEFSNNELAGGYGRNSGSVTIYGAKVLRNSIAGIVLYKGTTWQGLDSVIFEGNENKDVWGGADFDIQEEKIDLKTVNKKVENKDKPESVDTSNEASTEVKPSEDTEEE